MPTELKKEQNWLIIISLGILALFALGTILVYASSVLIPFVLAIFIYLLISPMLDYQVIKLKIPRTLAVTITLIIIIIMLSIMFFLLTQAVQMIVSTVAGYSESFFTFAGTIFAKAKEMGINFDYSGLVEDLQSRIPQLVADTFAITMGIASNIIFVSIFLIFLLAGRNSHIVSKGIYRSIDSRIRRYIVMKTVLSLITGSLVWAVLAIFRLELAFVFGMLTFILNFIPNIGSIVATFLPLPIAVAQFQNTDTAIPYPLIITSIVVIPGIIQMGIGNIVEPKVMGQGLKLHPVAILLALSFWGLLWGIIGMLLAVPITAAIRIVLMQFETLRPVGRLLAGQLPGYNVEPDEPD